MRCLACGEENAKGALYCKSCGELLDLGEKRTTRKRGVVDSTGATMPPPARKKPIEPRSTYIPRRERRKSGDDLFFERVDAPDELPYDDEIDGGATARKIKSGLAGLFLLAVLGFLFWLLVLPGGLSFRASIGMGAPASAYAQLGDAAVADGNIRRAAEQYYQALKRAPDSYEYAFAVAQTQAQLGDRERALSAYALCMTLRDTETAPYLAVAELYQQGGDTERAMNALRIGYDKTGSIQIFRAYEALKNPAQ